MVINFYSHFFLQGQKTFTVSLSSFAMDFNNWNILWELCFGLLAVLIVVGNSLTIWIFLKQKRRKRAHFLLISLAAADLLVGLLAVPLYMVVNLPDTSIPENFYASVHFDICTGLTSIFTLAVIALERMYAVGWPLRHRTLRLRAYTFAIVTPWILAATVTSLRVLCEHRLIGLTGFNAVITVSPYVPSFVICFAYCVIWWKGNDRMNNKNQQIQRETKLAKTLFLITGASLLTWLPFQIINMSATLSSRIYPSGIIDIIKLLQFSNSLVNVIIYPFRISEFKGSLLRILRSLVTSCSRHGKTSRRRTEDVNETAV